MPDAPATSEIAIDPTLGNLAHELRTPIVAAALRAEMLRDGYPGALPGAAASTAGGDIHAALVHALAVIDAAFTRPQGCVPLAESISLEKLAADAARVVSPLAQARSVHVDVSGAVAAVQVVGNERACRQIMINLLSNAIKFSAPGMAIEVVIGASAERAWLGVQDHGVGLTAIEVARVRRRLAAAPERSANAGRTGSGLMISAGLAQAMGATLQIDSQPGHGTRVTLAFPA
jgi:signal transduction histidine kinase